MGLKWMKTILEPDARIEKRYALPDVVVHYCDGGTPGVCRVGNISLGGIYVLTQERWYPDTILKMTLRLTPESAARQSKPQLAASRGVCVLAQAVRSGTDGVGLRFIFAGSKRPVLKKTYPECATDRGALRRFLAQAQQDRLDPDPPPGSLDGENAE